MGSPRGGCAGTLLILGGDRDEISTWPWCGALPRRRQVRNPDRLHLKRSTVVNAPWRVPAPVAANGPESLPVQGIPAMGDARPVVIVGGGPIGIRTAQELSRRGLHSLVFNAERWQPYNRVKLTPLLCGDAQLGQVMQPLTFPGPGRVDLYSEQSVVDIDRRAHTVTTRVGRVVSYSKLVLAVGSRAHIPPIPGRELSGVFSFRNIDDVERLVARSFRSRRTVVIGGGLLGLEAARGMARRGAETWVIEHNAHLMPNQLDAEAAGLLAARLAGMGLVVRTGARVAAIEGSARVEAIELAGGDCVPCDTVIICTGIRANIELARDVGLAVGRGIKVSDRMVTSDPDIFAVGECAEHNQATCGLVGPGFEHAVVVADNIAGIDRTYGGSKPSTKLKLVGVDVFSMGDVEQLAQRRDVTTATFRDTQKSIYRTVVLRKGRLVGALGIGDWPEVSRLQEAIRSEARILPWQRFQFQRQGALWPGRQTAGVHEWPRQATVCNCTGVTRGQISDAIVLGAVTYEDVQRETGASTVCGSCRNHITDLLGDAPAVEPVRWWRWLAGLSLAAAVLMALTLGLPAWPTAGSVAHIGLPDKLWLDGIWKQVSGYTLLAICALAATLSVRKRWVPRALVRRLGDYAGWRILHVGLGVGALIALFAHTGFRLGSNLNFWLMATFLATCLSGAAMGAATALEHTIGSLGLAGDHLRRLALWLHILALWPLPLLLGLHILSVYFY